MTRKLKDSLEKELGRLGTMEEQLEKEMEAYAENHQETREDLHNLLSMKGIGVISAMSLLYLFRTYPGAHRNEITALAGLDLGQRQSGSSLQGGRKISRAGDPLLRKVLSSERSSPQKGPLLRKVLSSERSSPQKGPLPGLYEQYPTQ